MKLLADIGNSQIKVAAAENQNLSKIKSFSLDEIEKLQKYISKNCRDSDSTLLFSSVLGEKFNKKFKKAFRDIYIKTTEFKSTKSLLSVKNSYTNPIKLGSDRWVQIVAANKIYQKDTMIVSCGSAISIDYTTSTGNHKGGLLLSGAQRYSSCFSDIHNLKNIKLANQKKNKLSLLESNTTKQISMGYRLMVSSCINEIYSSLCTSKKSKPILLLTGSYAKNISNDLRIKCLVEPYFVLKSLAWIQNEY